MRNQPLLSGRWTERKQQKKKVTFADDEESDDYVEAEERPAAASSSKSQQAMLVKVVKDEMQTLRTALDEVKVQMADIKKNKRALPSSRTNVWCTRCKKGRTFCP